MKSPDLRPYLQQSETRSKRTVKSFCAPRSSLILPSFLAMLRAFCAHTRGMTKRLPYCSITFCSFANRKPTESHRIIHRRSIVWWKSPDLGELKYDGCMVIVFRRCEGAVLSLAVSTSVTASFTASAQSICVQFSLRSATRHEELVSLSVLITSTSCHDHRCKVE